MKPLDVVVLYNEPGLPRDDPDWASEAGVLESVEAVSDALQERGHHVRRIGLQGDVSDILATLAQMGPADAVFNLFEGLRGVGRGEAEIAGLLELLGLAVTGSPSECLSLVRHKARTKWMLAGAGLPTAPFALIGPGMPADQTELDELLKRGPVIVKPAHEDASLGITRDSVVDDRDALARRIEATRARYGAVLVEQFIVGREFNAAILDLDVPELLPLAEIEFSGPGQPGHRIVTYEAKWDAGGEADRATPARCPARVDTELARRLGAIALSAFQLAGCRDYGRVDMRVNAAGEIFVLEINGNPDISPTAGFARALGAADWQYAEFVEQLLRHVAFGRAGSLR